MSPRCEHRGGSALYAENERRRRMALILAHSLLEPGMKVVPNTRPILLRLALHDCDLMPRRARPI